jgi:hypothetical protein
MARNCQPDKPQEAGQSGGQSATNQCKATLHIGSCLLISESLSPGVAEQQTRQKHEAAQKRVRFLLTCRMLGSPQPGLGR